MIRLLLTILLCIPLSLSAQKRIVSLSPSITYNLVQIGADDLVVGRTSYCPKSKKSVVVGDVLTVNIEKIFALKPDVVLTMSFTSQQTIASLRKLGINVVEMDNPKGFDDVCSQTIQFGKMADMEANAISLVKSQRNRIKNICSKINNNASTIFFQIGAKPIFPVITGTFMNEYVTMLGFRNIVTDYKGGGLSREFVVKSDPDYILITTMSGVGVSEKCEWEKFSNMKAVAQKHIYIVNDDEACCPSPIFFCNTLERIVDFVTNNQ